MEPDNVGKMVEALGVALRPEFETLVNQYVLRHTLVAISATVATVIVGWIMWRTWSRRDKNDMFDEAPFIVNLVGGTLGALSLLVAVISVINCLTPELGTLQCLLRGGN